MQVTSLAERSATVPGTLLNCSGMRPAKRSFRTDAHLLVRHVIDLDAGALVQELERDMLHRADAGRGAVERRPACSSPARSARGSSWPRTVRCASACWASASTGTPAAGRAACRRAACRRTARDSPNAPWRRRAACSRRPARGRRSARRSCRPRPACCRRRRSGRASPIIAWQRMRQTTSAVPPGL